jgi:ubiquinone/menaquinone biosynthesis C-methylase UbiE
MAPEGALAVAILKHGPSRYVAGDLQPHYLSVTKIDRQAIPYPDVNFDVVIGYHIFEHVAHPTVALSEVQRVLRRGGRFICQTPLRRALVLDSGRSLLQSEDDCIFFTYSTIICACLGRYRTGDPPSRLRQLPEPRDELLPDIDPEDVGVNDSEPFFDFVRDQPIYSETRP